MKKNIFALLLLLIFSNFLLFSNEKIVNSENISFNFSNKNDSSDLKKEINTYYGIGIAGLCITSLWLPSTILILAYTLPYVVNYSGNIASLIGSIFLGFFYSLGIFCATTLLLLIPGLLMSIICFNKYIYLTDYANKYKIQAILGLYNLINSLLFVALGLVLYFTTQSLVIIPLAIFASVGFIVGLVLTIVGFVMYYKENKSTSIKFEGKEDKINLAICIKL